MLLAAAAEIYVVTYYDDYSSLSGFPALARFQFQPDWARGAAGQGRRPPNAEKVRILGTARYLYSVTYYDARYRPIQVVRTATTAAWTA